MRILKQFYYNIAKKARAGAKSPGFVRIIGYLP